MFDGLARLIESVAKVADDPRIPWKPIVVASFLGTAIFRSYLNFRQYRVQCRESLPKVLEGKDIVDDATFRKSQAYNRTNLVYMSVKWTFNSLLDVWIFTSGFSPKLWRSASSVAPRFFGGGDLTTGILAYAAISVIKSVLGLPLQLYDTFVIEEKFGMNRQTLGIFIKDKLKIWGLWLVLGIPMQAVFQGIVAHFGYKFVVYAELFIVFLELMSVIVAPILIEPLFYKFTPLEEGELKTEIVKLAESEGFPPSNIYVVDGSTRSNHSNAYFVGLPGIKRIVLFDTLIRDQSTSGIVAIMAHELAHWKHNHVAKDMIADTLFASVDWFSLGLLMKNNSFYESLGFTKNQPVMFSLLLNKMLKQAYVWTHFASSWLSRRYEYDADAFAVEKGHGEALKQSLVTFYKSNLDEYDTDPLYSTYYRDHPAIPERLAAMELAQKKHA